MPPMPSRSLNPHKSNATPLRPRSVDSVSITDSSSIGVDGDRLKSINQSIYYLLQLYERKFLQSYERGLPFFQIH